MKTITLSNINTTQQSYQQFIDLYHTTSQDVFEHIHVELINWFAANMSAVLGGILDKIPYSNNISVTSPNTKTCEILQRNGFLAHYGYQAMSDINNTTIQYLKLKPSESRYFHEYVLQHFLQKNAMPIMSPQLQKKIAESIYEIFVNAQMHSETAYIYTCGQFFPRKNKIEFTIVDMGVGFKKKINSRFNRNLSSIQAIKWATKDGHSTKEGVTGGIGLALLKEFTTANHGTFQIISDDGFYQLSEEIETTRLFSASFPGTIINMQFRTDDNTTYSLSSDDNANTIF